MNAIQVKLTREHIKEWGGYNDSLPNLTEITAEEFSQSGFFTWPITGVEFRQIDPNKLNEGKLLYGTFITHTSSNVFFVDSPNENGFVLINDSWAKKVRYFSFSK